MSSSGPKVVNSEEKSGPLGFGLGLDTIDSRLGGRGLRGGGGVLSLDGSL